MKRFYVHGGNTAVLDAEHALKRAGVPYEYDEQDRMVVKDGYEDRAADAINETGVRFDES